jgi:hypothetical protein
VEGIPDARSICGGRGTVARAERERERERERVATGQWPEREVRELGRAREREGR